MSNQSLKYWNALIVIVWIIWIYRLGIFFQYLYTCVNYSLPSLIIIFLLIQFGSSGSRVVSSANSEIIWLSYLINRSTFESPIMHISSRKGKPNRSRRVPCLHRPVTDNHYCKLHRVSTQVFELTPAIQSSQAIELTATLFIHSNTRDRASNVGLHISFCFVLANKTIHITKVSIWLSHFG